MRELKTNAIMLRHTGKLGQNRTSNKPVTFPKGTLYEVVRLIDKEHSYVRVNGNIYLTENRFISYQTKAPLLKEEKMTYDILYRSNDFYQQGQGWKAVTSLPASSKEKAVEAFFAWIKQQKQYAYDNLISKLENSKLAVALGGKIVHSFKLPLSLSKDRDFLSEQAPEDPPQQMSDFQAPPQKPVSLDQVVDRYIVRYERESIPLEGQPGPGPAPGSQPAGGAPNTLEEDVELSALLSFLLLEQAPPAPPEEEEPPADPAGDPSAPGGADDLGGGGLELGGGGGDLGAGDDPGADAGGAPPPNAPPVVNTPKINLNDFSRSVARMVNNFDALLNPKTIILNRVEAYLKSNYDERTAKHFMQIMERNYGLNVTSVEYPEDNNEFPTPYAGSAVMSAGGGG